MKSFKEFYKEHYYIISEALHQHLQDILDEPEQNPDSERQLYDATSRKLSRFTKKARELLKKGEDTGLESDKPKKGSSRAVFFPKEHKQITLDGKPTGIRSVVKIAFPGQLDKWMKGDERLLGEHQNEFEADSFTSNNYGMLRENHDGSYSTNHEGVLAPVLSRHPDHHHLEMGHVSPIKKSDFQRLTATESHPKGLKFEDMYSALNKEYNEAHGQPSGVPESHTDEKHEHIMQHPFVQNVADMMFSTGFHPGDISMRNMGIWTHPHTGTQHPVMSDYGFSDDVAKHYWNRRKRLFRL